jgi:hypothetical protein
MALLLRLAALCAIASSCVTPEDCSLNGECTSGQCICVPPWTGVSCGQLDFLPARAPDGALYRRNGTSSWCASVLQEEGSGGGGWRAVVSQMAGGCGLNSWEANSQLVSVSSAGGALGPYAANESTIRLPFSHNPKLARAPDGTILLFHIGCGDNATHRYGPCSGGVTPPPPPPPAVRLSNGGACLAPAGGVFPQWTSPQGRPLSPLALVRGDTCTANTSGWLPDRANNRLYSAAWPTALVYIDCAACAVGTPATLLGPPSAGSTAAGAPLPPLAAAGATGLVFNKSTGTIEVAGCPGLCLSNGGPGALAPRCGGSAAEPWTASQVHLVPCASASAAGWSEAKGQVEGSAAPAAAAPRTCGGEFTELLTAPSLQGPWAFATAFGPNASGGWPFTVDNPSPLLLPNGSALVMFRSYAPYDSLIGLARAASWRGPWQLPSAPLFPDSRAEDPYLWYQPATASYHALFHSLGACGSAPGLGCHAFSRDSWAWTMSPTPAYNASVAFEGGSSTVFGRRERPQLILDPATGAALALISGVQPPRELQPPGGQGDMSYSLVAPLRTQ